MNENKKNNYTAPAVKVVAFQVEQGFAGSGETTPPSSNNTFIPVSRNRVDRTGNDTYHWETASEGWF